MNFSRYTRIKAARLLTAAVILGGAATGLLLPGCASDDFDSLRSPAVGDGTQLVLNLAIPHGEMIPASATRSDGESASEVDELRIGSLRLIILTEAGKAVINRPLLIPSEAALADGKTARYEVTGLNGGDKYKLYLIANMGDAVTFNGGTDFTEQDLKDVLIDCTSAMPVPGNLPMIYESDEIITAPKPDESALSKTLALKYACVKVRLNLLFDKTDATTAANYGEQGFVPTGLTLSNVSTKAPILISAAGQKDKIEGVTSLSLPVEGCYWNTWTEDPTMAGPTKEIITVSGNGADAPVSYPASWLSRHTVYLPERYAADSQLTFQLNGSLADKNNSVMTSTNVLFEPLPIGVKDATDGVEATDLPRGSFYEVVARITSKELEGNPMEATINKIDWQEATIPVDFVHTYLQLSKTRASVESLEEDYIVYQTDGSDGVKFVCDADGESVVMEEGNSVGKPAVVAVPKYDPARGQHMEFRVNPAIDITKVKLDENGEKKGTATGYLIAGNIKKQVVVDYNMTPFFEITPEERTIAYVAGGENATTFLYRTNLNGVVLTEYDDHTKVVFSKAKPNGTYEELTFSMVEGTPAASEGYIKVTSTAVTTTTVYNFYARPADGTASHDADSFGTPITVTIQPQLTAYRTYFRAINDYQTPEHGVSESTSLTVVEDGQTKSVTAGFASEFLAKNGYKLPSESTEKWADFWTNGYKNTADEGAHYVYIYNQVGNNTTFGNLSKNVCYLTGWNDTKMTADLANAGWYYVDLEKDKKGNWDGEANVSAEDRAYYEIPRPNETLMIFHNNGNGGDGSKMLHRLAHAKEPGVPLGSFADGEGWTLYDPTRDPRYNNYDNKPQIEDVAYTVYSDKPICEWYVIYGAWEDTRTKKVKMYANRWLPDGAVNGQVTVNGKTYVQNQAVTQNGKTYYKNVLWFKAPKGEYDKAIILKVGNQAPKYRFYFAVNEDSWQNPKIFIADTNWDNDTKQMTADGGRRADGYTYYYYDFTKEEMEKVTSSGKGIILRNKDYNGQHPLNGFVQLKANEIGVVKTGVWNLEKYSDYVRGNDNFVETTLMNGESYTAKTVNGTVTIEGYFDSRTGTWSTIPF